MACNAQTSIIACKQQEITFQQESFAALCMLEAT